MTCKRGENDRKASVECHYKTRCQFNVMNPNYKTKVWICVLTAVPQGSILVYFMIYVVIGKENRSAKITTRRTDGPNAIFCKKAFPTKNDAGVHVVAPDVCYTFPRDTKWFILTTEYRHLGDNRYLQRRKAD